MRRVALLIVLLLTPLTIFAVDAGCDRDVVTLRSLYVIRDVIVGGGSSYDINQFIDRTLDELREPLGEGRYRWVRWVRPPGDGPVARREHLVTASHSSSDFDAFESEAEHPYAIRVVVPRKRALFKANKDSYVGKVTVRYWTDGEEKQMVRTIDQWMGPGTSKSFDLGGVADRAEVTVEIATRKDHVNQSLVEIHFRQAVAQDDPANPNSEGMELLKQLRGSEDPVALDREIARVERKLFGRIESAPWTTISTRLRGAQLLMKSEKPEEQEKGRALLEATMKLLP